MYVNMPTEENKTIPTTPIRNFSVKMSSPKCGFCLVWFHFSLLPLSLFFLSDTSFFHDRNFLCFILNCAISFNQPLIVG